MIRLDEYCALDAVGLATAIRIGDISANEAAQCAADSIRSSDTSINAIAELYDDRVLDGCTALDSEAEFYGVPMLMKDAGSAEQGHVQAQGSRLGKERVVAYDSRLVCGFRANGLNIIGRTTTPEFTIAATTESELYGATCNPWDLQRSCGGSSGGAAAAVAAGYVPIAHGTDTGGSIRIPAACCGVVGFKPSRAWYGDYHVDAETVFGGLNSEFVLTKSVRDASALFQCMRAENLGKDDKALRIEIRELELRASSLRVAVTDQLPGLVVDPEIVDAVRAAAGITADIGFNVADGWPTYDEPAWIKADGVVWAQSIAWLADELARETGRKLDQKTLEPVTLLAIEEARGLTATNWFSAMSVFERTRVSVDLFFEQYDFLISPTVATPAPELSYLGTNLPISFDEFMDRTGKFSPFTPLFNVSGHPAISIPAGMTSTGLPIGIQIVGRRDADLSVLALARILEQAINFKPFTPHVTSRSDRQAKARKLSIAEHD